MNQKHVDLLKSGSAEWNKWRVENPTIVPDLSGADLRNASLSGADLRAANFKNADLRAANLRAANLRTADLRGANLSNAILWSASLTGAELKGADLSGADLRSVNFRAADLKEANLTDTDLGEANFRSADLTSATLIGAKTNDFTDFRNSIINRARLWVDQDPIDDWDAEIWRIADIHTVKARISIAFKEHLYASDLAAIMHMLDAGLFEYERQFIVSLEDVVGKSIAAACLHRLQTKRKKNISLLKFESDSHEIDAIFVPMSILLLGASICNDVEDALRRSEICTVIKTAFLRRAEHVAQDLQKTLRSVMEKCEPLLHYDLEIVTANGREIIPELTIKFISRIVKE
jgi:hypothetical protein